MRRLTLRVFVLTFLLAASADKPCVAAANHAERHQAAVGAFKRGDYAAAARDLEQAVELRPDHPRYLYDLAIAHTRQQQPGPAIAALHRLVALGVVMPVAKETEFQPLHAHAEFAGIVDAISAHQQPHGSATPLFQITGHAGIAEGIAFRARTGEFFVADVHQRCVWRRSANGTVSRFTRTDERISGVFDVEVDEERHRLWAAMSMMEAVAGGAKADHGGAALAAFDLATGELVAVLPVPNDGRDHLLGDLLLAPDGTVYATDSAGPILWRLLPGATTPEVFLSSPFLGSLQGLALVDDGRKMIVSDYASGLVVVDLAMRALHPLRAPAKVTLLGIDGIAFDGSTLIAVQNGVEPQRVLRVSLSRDFSTITEVSTLAAALPGFDDLTLLTLANGRPIVIAQSGWSLFDAKNPTQLPPHTVQVFQLPPFE